MNADSVKARLKNFAVKNACTFQEALTYYGLERTIYRISVSKYAEQFVLKGESSCMRYLIAGMNGQLQMWICLQGVYPIAGRK